MGTSLRLGAGWMILLGEFFMAGRPLGSAGAAGIDLAFPAHHPYLALTPADLARARERAARFPWAQRSLEQLAAEAEGRVRTPWAALPEKGDTEHWNIASGLFRVGLAYAFTGEKKYAEWVREGLLAYADLYPGLPLTNLRCKVFTQSSLYEAMWLVSLVQAYDLVADSGAFTDAQKAHVENDLLRAALECFKIDDFQNDPRIRDLHYRCYNFQAWHLSAIGLVGLAVKDAALVDYAVNSPYGFRHLVAHDIRDDGLFWERSVGYHHFVLQALLPFTEAMAHCGVDLYHLAVPNERDRDEDAHYPTDSSDRPKSLRLLWEAPFYLAFPDLSYIALGDSDRGPLSANWLHLVGYHRYRDPKLAWLLGRSGVLEAGEVTEGRVGFLHYYRYCYRYQEVRLNGRPVRWDRRDPTLDFQPDAFVADDGGVSQPDRYLLNDADLADFTLEWTMTRLADRGEQERAWVVFHVSASDPANRKTFALPSWCPELDRPYRFRLTVKGQQAELFRDGQKVSDQAAVYVRTPDWPWLIYDLPEERAAWPLREGRFANTGRFEKGCSLFPASGVAVLRQQGGDFTAHPEGTAVALSYGPYGGGHGHPDKLSVAVYALGKQWIPHFGSMPYETHWKAEWTAHTVSHNTVVVDGISQQPTGERDVQWPVDSASQKVIGQLERWDPARRLVSASCEGAYPGLTLRRTVRLLDGCVLDDFQVVPSAPPSTHRFDYVLHWEGTFAESSRPLSPRSGPLGTKCGFQHVEQKGGTVAEEPMALTFESEGQRVRLWVVPVPGSPVEVILAEGLTNSPGVKAPMVLVRCEGPSARFLALIEPVAGGSPVDSVRWQKGVGGPPPALVLRRAGGVRRISLP